jgi:hypothetical protein
MGKPVKLVVGLLAVLLMGWVCHGPLGRGAALVDQLEAQARAAISQTELPGIQVRMMRDPLARIAILSGPANDLQREGLGSQWGVNDYVRSVPGIAGVRWDGDRDPARIMPLLLETELLLLIAYLVGLGLGWLLFGRRKRQSFLD